MKKVLFTALLVALIAVVAVSAVACNPDGNRRNPGYNEYETGTYTVTFNANGADSSTDAANLTGVKYGSTIAYPTDGDGNRYVPTKLGYNFLYWEWTDANGATRQFRFEGESNPDVITKNTTISAAYEAKKFEHVINYTSGLEYEIMSNGSVKYSLVDDFYGAECNKVTITHSDGEEVKFVSEFKKANDNFKCAYIVNADGTVNTENKFCFWYYVIQQKDDQGRLLYVKSDGELTADPAEAMKDANDDPTPCLKPIQFTKWKEESKDVVASMETYGLYESLTLYPMFEQNLPKVTVEFEGGHSEVYPLNGTIYESVSEEAKSQLNVLQGEEFAYWYYQLENKDSEGNVTSYSDFEFIFKPDPQVDEDGNEVEPEASKTPTDLRDATGNKGVFTPVTLNLKARRVSVRRMENPAAFEAFCNEARNYFADERTLLAIEEGQRTPEQKEQLEAVQANIRSLLTAKLVFASGMNFVLSADDKYAPFDAAHAFEGTITSEGAAVTLTISLDINFKDLSEDELKKTEYSLFGYVKGKIENINVAFSANVQNIRLVKGNLYIGALAAESSGTIRNCEVNVAQASFFGGEEADLETGGRVVFGGLVARNSNPEAEDDMGVIESVRATVNSLDIVRVSATVGGIVGNNLSSTSVKESEATLTLNSIDDATFRAILEVGGLTGTNGGTIEGSHATMLMNAGAQLKLSTGTLSIGALTGRNSRAVVRSYGKIGALATGTENAKAVEFTLLGGALNVGGLVGHNEGYVYDCYSEDVITVNAPATVTSATLSVGGLVGNNNGDKFSTSQTETSVGAISYSYTRGSILINVADGAKNVNVNAGGLSGQQLSTRLMNAFTAMSIDAHIKLDEGLGNQANIGYLFGKLFEKAEDSTYRARLYYIDDNEGAGLKLNDEPYKITQKTEDGEEEPTSESNFGNIYGTLISSKELNYSLLTDNSSLNFDSREKAGSTSSNRLYVWTLPESDVTEGPFYPTLN